ncbi:MAG: methylated-DNA--[protein]-cysteine S-methyltransferase [Saprospiraceae bacterium]|jgi:AraC family transcriptional regulator of adaptative response/methylated-DNA-[protein]-cysteine methyltransferase|nr:methylated-DNA--[protein]-cysteine S-methyltransferase [Saprospiraceae bacterium]
MNQTFLTYTRFDSPIGSLLAATADAGICLLEFEDIPERWESALQTIAKGTGSVPVEGDHPHLRQAQQELAEYFSGKRTAFEVPLVLTGTDFQKSVWQELLRIPYGATRSYKQQALALGNLEAIRAVAAANGRNQIAIVIPCHRVIGDDGSLIGYGGGLWRKKWLLELERDSGLAVSETTPGSQLRLL